MRLLFTYNVTPELSGLRDLFERVAATRTIEQSIRAHCRDGPLSFRTSIALLVEG